MPGYLDRVHARTTLARCHICHGVDLLALGFIHHEPDCPRHGVVCRPCLHRRVVPVRRVDMVGT